MISGISGWSGVVGTGSLGISGWSGVVGSFSKSCKIPKEWINKLVGERVPLPIHNFIVSGADADTEDFSCIEEHAIEICQKYLKITDSTNEIMDRILDEEFRKV